MRGEPVDPATAIGSSESPMKKKGWHSKVQVRLFEPPEVPLESIDERGDFDWHDMPEHDKLEPRTPHDDFGEEHCVGAHDTILHGVERIKSTKSLDVTFLVDDACVPIKIQKIVGNCPINWFIFFMKLKWTFVEIINWLMDNTLLQETMFSIETYMTKHWICLAPPFTHGGMTKIEKIKMI